LSAISWNTDILFNNVCSTAQMKQRYCSVSKGVGTAERSVCDVKCDLEKVLE